MPSTDASWNLTVRCSGCGAELTVEPDRQFIDCEYCHASSVLDLGAAAPCFQVAASLEPVTLEAKLRGWLREQGLKESEATIEIGGTTLIPFWMLEAPEGKRSLLASERADLPLPPDARGPAGQLEKLDVDQTKRSGAKLSELTMPLAAALGHLGPDRREPGEVRASLIYAPFVTMSYIYGGIPYEALIDASTGKIYAVAVPRVHDPSLDRRLGLLLTLSVAVYIGLAALLPGLLLPLAASLAASIPLGWALRDAVFRRGLQR